MKVFLVVYFFVNNAWYPGEVIAPDGWSSIEYESQEECEKRKEFMNQVFDSSKFKGVIKGVCQVESPDLI